MFGRAIRAALTVFCVVAGILVPASAHPVLPIPQVMAPRAAVSDGSWGTATVVGPSMVLTAAHIMAYAKWKGLSVTIEFPDGPSTAVLPSCETSESLDLVVLPQSVPGYPHDHPVPLDVRPPQVGEEVHFAGFARGTRPSRADFSARITSVGNDLPIQTYNDRTVTYRTVAWARAPIGAAGMSGGPAYDSDGELIGIICCIDSVGAVGFVPLHESLRECPLPGR